MSKDWMLTPKEEAEAWNIGYGRISRVKPVKALVPKEVSEHVQEAIAEIKQAQARKLVEWGDGDCPHKCGWRKRECRKCWQQLRQQVGE